MVKYVILEIKNNPSLRSGYVDDLLANFDLAGYRVEPNLRLTKHTYYYCFINYII